MKSIRNAGQAALLAKVMFINSFFAVYGKTNTSGDEVRPREFPKD
jgi:hypothetical protein